MKSNDLQEHAMKRSQNRDGQASAGDPEPRTDAGLSDDVLDMVTGGGIGSANSMQDKSNALTTNVEPKPINDLVGRVVNKNFA
ncbi:hypothetical protein [Noviherbaspirillum soli]|uniref:hypothetical protein n=1 Tax=Noviherbaspirillum soli TaxID=1064518 RepID=UPI00188C193E|nr:hypothetical protein [Noviherbaspirillum soli]